MVGKIATGEVEDGAPDDDGEDKAAQAMGKKGGAARATSMTPERRAEIAKKALGTRSRLHIGKRGAANSN